ncbi:YpiF family protein [Paenibacillus sp. CC-CFT747]|nr:YpiF family protein [Paenibacillus sp. CC-CFT747]
MVKGREYRQGGGQVKFSEIREEQWKDLQPYLDTCLLPITGLTGTESPWMTTEALEMLRDIMDLVENPYKGRLVTYPALHYFSPPGNLLPRSTICVEN